MAADAFSFTAIVRNLKAADLARDFAQYTNSQTGVSAASTPVSQSGPQSQLAAQTATQTFSLAQSGKLAANTLPAIPANQALGLAGLTPPEPSIETAKLQETARRGLSMQNSPVSPKAASTNHTLDVSGSTQNAGRNTADPLASSGRLARSASPPNQSPQILTPGQASTVSPNAGIVDGNAAAGLKGAPQEFTSNTKSANALQNHSPTPLENPAMGKTNSPPPASPSQTSMGNSPATIETGKPLPSETSRSQLSQMVSSSGNSPHVAMISKAISMPSSNVIMVELAAVAGAVFSSDAPARSISNGVIFNAAMLPGWPYPTAFAKDLPNQSATKPARQFFEALGADKVLSDAEMAEYVAKLGFGLKFMNQLRKLAKTLDAAEKKSLFAFLAAFLSSIEDIARGFLEAVEKNQEELLMGEAILAGGEQHSFFGEKPRSRLKI